MHQKSNNPNSENVSHTREKFKLEKINNQRDAIETHEMVGKEVRAAIANIGVALPENIPPAEPIKNLEKRLKKKKPVYELEDKDSFGLNANPVDQPIP